MGPATTTADDRARLAASHVKSFRENGLDGPLLDRAVGALLKHDADRRAKEESSRGKSTLVEDDRAVHVQISLAKVPQRPSPKPVRVDIPHPLVRVPRLEGFDGGEGGGGDGEEDGADYLDEADVCLLVQNDRTKEWVKDLIAKFPSHLGRIKKVLTLDSLRTKRKRFAQRRELLESYDVFLADDRILPMLGKALGKSFFERRRQPIPIRIERREALPFAVQRCLRSTYMCLSAGTCVTIKVGTTAMPPRHLAENVQSAVRSAAEKLPRKWANVAGVYVKTPRSVALPVYSRTPEELAEIAALAGVREEEDADADDAAQAKKRRKQASSKGDAEEGKRRKRRKKELAAKSPLLKALKKQKEEEEKKEAEPKSGKRGKGKRDGPKSDEKAKKDEGSADRDDEKAEAAMAEKEKPQSKSAKKKKKTKAEKKRDAGNKERAGEEGKGDAPNPSEEEGEDAGGARKEEPGGEEAEAAEGAEKRKKKKKAAEADGREARTPKGEKKAKKRRESDDGALKAAATKASDEGGEKKAFMASKKFRGAKKGYHFRRGKEGVGYYQDVVPTPDRAALEAMARAFAATPGGRRGGGGGGGRRKSGGGGGRRRGGRK